MDESIGAFCNSIASFCNHLQSSCDALKQSIERRPIPLDSASSTFVQCLNRRVSTASTDLNLLDSMSFGTVSFLELLGHCNEVHKKNQSDVAELEDRLRSFGYIPEPDFDDEEDEECSGLFKTDEFKLKTADTDPLLDDSFNLQDLGLSDACLATIASDANSMIDSPPAQPNLSGRIQIGENAHNETSSQFLEGIGGEVGDDLKSIEVLKWVIDVSKDDYEALPSYMRTLATWEDLVAAVGKINLFLRQKQKTSGENFFHQDELSSLELGHKGRSYLLLLLRMNCLVVETIGGSISYRVL